MKGIFTALSLALAAVLAGPAYANPPSKELDGIEAKCAKAIAVAAWDELQSQSWTQMAKLLSLSGAAEMVALTGEAIRAELRGCFEDVYRLGVEDGQLRARLERAPEAGATEDKELTE